MIRNSLLEQGYNFQDKEPKEMIIAIIWAFFVLFATVAIGLFFMLNYDEFNVIVMGEAMTAVMVVAGLFVYLLLKFLTTLIFCHDNNNIKLKLFESKYMPVCFCREAFRTWQVVLIYLIPIIIYHAGLFITGLFLMGGSPTFVILLFIMEFFMGLDLTLVVYVIYIKIRYKPDYIAVNHHVYNLTLYSRTYVRRKKRRA